MKLRQYVPVFESIELTNSQIKHVNDPICIQMRDIKNPIKLIEFHKSSSYDDELILIILPMGEYNEKDSVGYRLVKEEVENLISKLGEYIKYVYIRKSDASLGEEIVYKPKLPVEDRSLQIILDIHSESADIMYSYSGKINIDKLITMYFKKEDWEELIAKLEHWVKTGELKDVIV